MWQLGTGILFPLRVCCVCGHFWQYALSCLVLVLVRLCVFHLFIEVTRRSARDSHKAAFNFPFCVSCVRGHV